MASSPVRRRTNWFKYLQFNIDVDTAQDTRTILLTIFTLIAATTFQAGVNPPGGVWQEATDSEPRPVERAEEHKPGSAIFSSRGNLYYVFLLSNTYAFSNSILVILSLTHKFPLRFEIRAATLSMAVTYGSSIYAITQHGSVKYRLILTVAFLPFLIRILIIVYDSWYNKKSQSNKVVLPTSSSVGVKIPSTLASGVRSSPVTNRRPINSDIV